jgi:hypothetical protein
VEYPVPDSKAVQVKHIAAVDPGDPSVMGAYPLNETQVIEIAGAIRTPLNPTLYDYFLEAFAD